MKFDEIYRDSVNDLHPSANLMAKLMKSEETKIMKFSKKKAVILGLTASLFVGTTVFAAGHITSYRSWSDPKAEMHDYVAAVEKSHELGSELTLPESFANGYEFAGANENGFNGMDDNGNVLVSGTNFFTRYIRENSPELNLFIDPVTVKEDVRYSVESKMIGDVEVHLNQAVYKFVPTDYELTEEDKQNMEDNHYELSYGSDQVELQQYNGISFARNGKYYSMFAWDSDMTADEWYEMAEELLSK